VSKTRKSAKGSARRNGGAKKAVTKAKRPVSKTRKSAKAPARRKSGAKKAVARAKRPVSKKKKSVKPPAKRKAAASKSSAPSKRKASAKTPAKRPPAKRKAKSPRARGVRGAPVVKIREAYAKAVALYEKGLKALQRKNFDGASAIFRQVLQVPEERELHERARLYLNVCERESSPKAKVPRTVDDRIFAATLALNRRDVDEALLLLRSAASSRPADDHVQYMLALALASSDEVESAAQHLKKAIALNPDNRLQARQEPDFEAIRGTKPFLDAVRTP
jgi:DnaK suppressor protein